MATNLIELARNYLTPEVIQKASALVGESPAATRRALETATPAIVTGLASEGSTISGAQRLKRILDEEGGVEDTKGSLTELLRTGSGEDLVQRGTAVLGRIFGGRMSQLVEASATASGTQASSMTSLLGLAGPIVLGVLGHQVRARRLDAAGLASLLEEQKSSIPPGLASALGLGREREREREPVVTRTATPVEPVRRREPESTARYWPLLLLIPLLLLGGLLLRKRDTPATWAPDNPAMGVGVPEAPTVEAPRAPELRAPVEATPPEAPRTAQPMIEGSLGYDLAQFLDSSTGDPSKRFAFDEMNFEFANANLTPGSLPTLDAVAAVLKAHPTSQILVEGHTDSTGVPAANQRLSLDRANALKSALTARGVDADRITTAGLGQDRPVASNDTAEGRAKNRRTEIVVTRR
jgi:OmpA-OmpF porin, OOP family